MKGPVSFICIVRGGDGGGDDGGVEVGDGGGDDGGVEAGEGGGGAGGAFDGPGRGEGERDRERRNLAGGRRLRSCNPAKS